ncbi:MULTISPECIES: amino acid ABC transporter permease [Pseudomonas]|jgi:polar amino acid transport system permease protein/cystine transport system permease protein|uniref:amino acid ABC transporter permease n=1 Tax=Pseudomonas TaxID=286 RepID=UPI00209CCA85|nr:MULTISPECIES: amino acid ABC transporter permease [Pseudomonas]MCP1455403.1 polar amino acid transport system permease protein/cystine transport system permease protein [Pseudomonas kilonensis]UVM63459.1 amino acid ABC transporter permease [Pseudomonas sp. B21-010]WPN65550.1 amino acid ABC transporter permease [Pseudomonas sp. P9_32]WPN71300.1 amino acid ABC transporter permease [Pseudomonas sp. P9_35]
MFDSSELTKSLDLLPYFLEVLGIGALTTLGLTAASFIVAALLGFGLALMRLSRHRVLRWVASVYLEVFRNVPILTQLFILYFGLTYIGITLPAIGAAIIGFGLNGAAMLSEVFRSSILNVDRGQSEAAFSIGMTRAMAMRMIVLPQAFKVSIPGMANFAIGLLKDTSLASAAAVPELTFKAKMLVSETYQTNLIYFLLAIIYLALSLVLAHWAARTERRLTVIKEH